MYAKTEVLDLLKEMVTMSSKDYIDYCTALRNSDTKEAGEKVELTVKAVSRIRKAVYYNR